ncbi:hypothetical protein SAMN05444156_2403 [Verrucomicrobium sp. GAS474]|uniref:hypothetical protein n=1 Tax=Verrucomicrobium sp. GAS474 TaxID=1882831 RepID=UPI00087C5DE4|nr:hypothetical protein [Verrucomicrobium sp. GAS474]SDU17323.1 hypothetical protein SAMN05444156_2403 [Verrucomicrobium sp. GAS474]
MMPSSEAPSPAVRLGFFFLLAVDFMLFAALVGGAIVLREGAAFWVAPGTALALRGLWPAAVASVVLLLSLGWGKTPSLIAMAAGLLPWSLGLEAWFGLRHQPLSSFAAFFLLAQAYVGLNALALFVWLTGRGTAPEALLLPGRRFVAGSGLGLLLFLHWSLYS